MKSPKKSAIIVIDVQKSFPECSYWRDDDLPLFADRLSTLIHGAMAKNVPIVHIFHTDPDGPFRMESGLVTRMDFVPEHFDARFYKTAHNAFTTTGLGQWLTENGINHLVITGIRSEQCCETTTRVASDLGYDVDYVTEATLTFPMTHPVSGRTFSPAEIKEKTELVLAGRFARIVDVETALGQLGA